MPVIKKGDLVLVTGASGFIASHAARTFLREGYRVRGTVRSKEKGDYLKNLFKDEGDFEYVIAEDITKDGVFDEAVKGVDAVAHLASPFYTTNVKDPQELIGPATKGTTGVLKSVQKNNPDIKRVVITSSVAAVMSVASREAPVTYTEADWNVDAPKHVEENGLESTGPMSYQASKTLAEQALWDFVKKENPKWDAVAINPPMVLGPVIHQCESPEKLNTSVAAFYKWATAQMTEKDLPAPGFNWVDVDAVAMAHVHALTVEEAGGQRFITSCGPYCGQDFCDLIHKHFSDLPNVAVGKPGTHDEICKDSNIFDGSKAAKVLGVKYQTLDENVLAMGKSLRERFNF